MVCSSRWRKRQLFCGLLLSFILFYVFGIGLLIHKAASTARSSKDSPPGSVTSVAGTLRENPQHLRYRLGMKAAPAPPVAVMASPARQDQETKDLRMGAHRDVRLEQCTALRYSPTPLPITALVSFPGSGNTWLRYLVQQATGNFTRIHGLSFRNNNVPYILPNSTIHNPFSVQWSLPWKGVCHGRGFAVDGSLPWMGVCRGREFALEGGLPWKGVCRGREFAVEGSLPWKGVRRGREFAVEGSSPWKGVRHGR
uniref:Uncharacterized protein n=1 Tax=Branchiostoma floridae TaxID=7739 RepID=C3XVN8_BRAFL|eukprot:XP_002611822.1 hypothetical protein BRAFLDRAFT_83155 [Branchiostoma floridae]